MIAFKFLAKDAVAPFTGFAWPVGEWIEARGPIENGIHGCRPRDLAYWTDLELWKMEAGGEIVESSTQITARRGRLLERIVGWNQDASVELAVASVRHARDEIAKILAERGDARASEQLSAASDLTDIAKIATRLAGGSDALPYLELAATNHKDWAVGAITFVAATSVSICARDPERMKAERLWQSEWLTEHLGLTA